MANYTSGRHTFARGPVSEQVKVKLVGMIKASGGKEDLLAEDIIEVIAVARNDRDGFRAVDRLLADLAKEYVAGA